MVIFAGTVDARAGGGDAGVALRGLDRAVAAHGSRRSTRSSTDAGSGWRNAPSGGCRDRRHALAAVLREVAAQASTTTPARADALHDARAEREAPRPRPAARARSRRRDGLGVVYRSVPGRGLRFHPLGSFGQLNKYVSAGQRRRATSLAYALLARAHEGRRGLTWEYDFRAAGGNPPWTSGMAQAVAAQALARAGLVPEARLAFAAIPNVLVHERETGTWIRLYGFSDIAVLNAQLQAAISLADYARLARDERAARLATACGARRSARYRPSTPATGRATPSAAARRHSVITSTSTSLLWKLARTTGNERWATQAADFRDDWRRPPAIRGLAARAPALPLPRDGFRDAAAIRFWLSKPASVELAIAGERVTRQLGPGLWTVLWEPGERAPGRYSVELDGGRSSRQPARDAPPAGGRRPGHDGARASRLRGPRAGVLARPRPRDTMADDRDQAEPRRRHASGAPPSPPARRLYEPRLQRPWYATLSGRDSAGNESEVVLGRVGPTWRELAAGPRRSDWRPRSVCRRR